MSLYAVDTLEYNTDRTIITTSLDNHCRIADVKARGMPISSLPTLQALCAYKHYLVMKFKLEVTSEEVPQMRLLSHAVY